KRVPPIRRHNLELAHLVLSAQVLQFGPLSLQGDRLLISSKSMQQVQHWIFFGFCVRGGIAGRQINAISNGRLQKGAAECTAVRAFLRTRADNCQKRQKQKPSGAPRASTRRGGRHKRQVSIVEGTSRW